MSLSIASTPYAAAGMGAAAGGASPSVALQDKLERCQRQLGDWKACPSGKTPEGKQIIENLEAQIRTVQARIASSSSDGNGNGMNSGTRISNGGDTNRVSGSGAATSSGRLLDVYA